MHREIVGCEKPLTAGDASILPVVKLSLIGLHTGDSVHFHALKQPEYIVVRRAGKTVIYNMSGEEVPISQAKSECPGFEAALAECYGFPLPSDWLQVPG